MKGASLWEEADYGRCKQDVPVAAVPILTTPRRSRKDITTHRV